MLQIFNGGQTILSFITNLKNHRIEVNIGSYFISGTGNINDKEGLFNLGPTQISVLPLINVAYNYQFSESGPTFKIKVGTRVLGFGVGCTI